MKYSTHYAGKIAFLEIDNEIGLKIVICPVGASIKSISFNGELMAITPKETQVFLSRSNILGKTIGPLIPQKDTYSINGVDYQINEAGYNYNCSNFIFTSQPLLDKHVCSVSYTFKKKRMSDGLPGNITYFVSYSLSDKSNELLIDYKAISDEDTIMSLSNNLIFNLGSENLADLLMTMNDKAKSFSEDQIVDDELPISKNQNLVIENNEYKSNILISGYDSIKVTSDNEQSDTVSLNNENMIHRGIFISPRDNKQIIKKNEIYHRQILYKFETKNL